jgi:ribosomal protein L37AE/L43A
MRSFMEFCGAPALCQACGIFQVANYLDKQAICRDCGGPVTFYDDPGLWSRAEGARRDLTVFDWRVPTGVFALPDANYVCPKCRQQTLRFEQVGLWD